MSLPDVFILHVDETGASSVIEVPPLARSWVAAPATSGESERERREVVHVVEIRVTVAKRDDGEAPSRPKLRLIRGGKSA